MRTRCSLPRRALINLVNQLRGWKKDRSAQNPSPNIQQLEKEAESNPANFQLAFNLASAYLQAQQPDRAFQVLDRVVNDPRADASALRGVIEAYSTLNRSKLQGLVDTLEAKVRANPTNFQTALGLAEGYRQLQQPDKAMQTLDKLAEGPLISPEVMQQVVNAYALMNNYPKLETTLEKLIKVSPEMPEAWYTLAAVKLSIGKQQEVMPNLRKAIELSDKRRKADPKAADLLAELQKDPKFAPMRDTPEFKQIVAGNK